MSLANLHVKDSGYHRSSTINLATPLVDATPSYSVCLQTQGADDKVTHIIL